MPQTDKKRCIVIPAIKKSAVIPDQLVKKLAGATLIQRALNTALRIAPSRDVHVITDSEEISLICARNGVRFTRDPKLTINSLDIVKSLLAQLELLSDEYTDLIIYRASAPLITAEDLEDAWTHFCAKDADGLVSVKSVRQRVWKSVDRLDTLLFDDGAKNAYVETKSIIILKSSALKQGGPAKIVPYFMNDRAVEINSYQDWWICEKLLQRRHIVFVVAGYAAIGMGHIFRALMLAHEIADHRISFLCTRRSELAAAQITERDYRTKVQQSDDLAAEVLSLRPDLVINDILDTDAAYLRALKSAGIPAVNFEDEGPGAALADLVVNALYEQGRNGDPRHLYGYKNFCLRDEFLAARQNEFRSDLKRIILSFGGTDDSDFTRRSLDALLPLIRERGLTVDIVAGPGYAHKESLQNHLDYLNMPGINFTYATNVMSKVMENADLAVCSAGRTVYELAHMRVPAIILAHHPRESLHKFARPRNGFEYLGVMHPFRPRVLQKAFQKLLDPEYRELLHQRQSRFDFRSNKAGVIRRITALLN